MELDPRQRDVVDHGRGALLVSGSFGTGKTTVLRERFLRLLAEGADPDRVVLVVGSRRARDEIRGLLLAHLPASVPNLRVATTHGLAYQVVSARYHELRYERPPTILAAPEQFAKVQELLAGEDPARWPAYGNLLGLRGFADAVRQLVLRAQEALLGPDEISRAAQARSLGGWRELADFLRRYQEVLDAEGAVDFAGLVAQAAIAAEIGEPPFDHVLVDDYQDATFGTERLLAALRPESLVVAGNPDGHVFSFQGTTSVPLERFAERFAAEVVRLDTDHRAPKVEIVAHSAAHSSEEYAGVARELRRLHIEERVPWHELAIVVRRQGPHLGGLLRALDDAGVPRHAPESGLALTAEPATVPFTLALRWIARPLERDGLAEPVLVSDLGGLSPAAARNLLRMARGSGRSPREALSLADLLTAPGRDEVHALARTLARAEALAGSVIDAFRALWEGLPYAARLVEHAERSATARRDLDAVVAFARAVERAGGSADPSAAAFVDQLEAGRGGPGVAGIGDADADAVQVLTAHGSTGMEFDTVIVVGVTEGNFPSLTRPEPMFDLAVLEGDASRSDRMRLRLADERRLFGSVIGRAKRSVVFTASEPAAGEEGARSRFVEERGIEWRPMADSAPQPISVAEAAAAWRRAIADPSVPPATRLAALDGIAALGIDARRWWFQNDWTDTGRLLHETLRLSFSRLERLENCELQFVLGEELGLSKRGGHQAWVGKLVHELVERCEKGEIERSLDALVAALENRWQDAPFPSKAVSDAFKRVAIEWMLPNWFKSFGGLPAAQDGTEVGFEFEFEGATISGKIDRIGPHDHGFRITDFKTGNPEKAPKAAESLQLGIYYLGVTLSSELERFRPVRAVDLSFLRGHWRTHEIVTLAWPVSPAGEEEYQARVRERLSSLIRRIRELDQAGTYRPDPAADCYFCDFKPLCPLYPEGQPLFSIEEVAAT
ncbi:MAG TPA: ATP-dependent DNA helicase [Actinomycetota bacterium]|nr:ATP-dependent DNA helicase [Actinomycetota bacterium]